MEIVTYTDAKLKGLKFYNTGKPCGSGHYAQRRYPSATCLECEVLRRSKPEVKAKERENHAKWRYKNAEKVAFKKAEYRANNLEVSRASNRKSQAKLRSNEAYQEKARQYFKKWAKENPEKRTDMRTQWRLSNPDKHAAQAAKRKSYKLRAIPLWANLDAIREIYKLAKQAGKEVDHIIPLISKHVCGLHVENNLQLLSPIENRRKGNTFDPTIHEKTIL